MANFIPEDKIQEIKQAVNILEIISETVSLKKAGQNYVGLCPFHHEKTGSFMVNTVRQSYHCFGCGEKGNAISFMMKTKALSFPETLRKLANRYGISLPEGQISKAQQENLERKNRQYAINREAAIFYHTNLLQKKAAEPARNYLKNRGLNIDIAKIFQIGFAPNDWHGLVKFFQNKDYDLHEIEQLGLFGSKKPKKYYDRFRNRIIFPIVDLSSKTVGFGGRLIDEGHPKYLNSPESQIFYKNKTLYGINLARKNLMTEDCCFVVEGYMDLIALYKNGIQNVVATLGTSLSSAHMNLIKKYTNNIILVYDADAAGIKAAARSARLFLKENISAKILVLPAGYDPDAYLATHSPKEFIKLSKNARGNILFLLDMAINKHGLTAEGKLRIILDVQEDIALIPDRLKRSLYIKEISEHLKIDENDLLLRIEEIVQETKPQFENQQGQNFNNINGHNFGIKQHPFTKNLKHDVRSNRTVRPNQGIRIEHKIIAMMVQYPEIIEEVKKRNSIEDIEDLDLRNIAKNIIQLYDSSQLKKTSFMALLQTDASLNPLKNIIEKREKWNHDICLKLLTQFEMSINRKQKQLVNQIKLAEENNDKQLVDELLKKKQQISKRNLLIDVS